MDDIPAPPPPADTPPPAPVLGVNQATRLLIGSLYTRGLWSPFAAWRSLARCPYRWQSIDWGIDRELLRSELRRAFFAAWLWTIVELVGFMLFFYFEPTIWGPVVLFLIILQWLVYPYFAIRSAFKRLDNYQAKPNGSDSHTVILKETDGSIGDLGYLLREATFSVDCTKKLESWGETQPAALSPLAAESFYSEVESAFATTGHGIGTARVVTIASHDAQPPPGKWTSWLLPDRTKASVASEAGLPRLLVTGENRRIDGLAAMEVVAKTIGPHVSFRLRMRWLPGFKHRLRNLALLVHQKLWWRGIVVPLGCAFLLFIACFVGGLFISSNQPGASAGFSLGAILSAKLPPPLGINSLFDVPFEDWPAALPLFLFSSGPTTAFVWVALLVVFLPALLLIFSLLLRGVRFLRGLLYSASGTCLFVGANPCLRFTLTGSGGEDEDSLQTAISYLQIMEQVVTNRIVDVLQRHGVDTASIRDEMKQFVNQGIYLTGGEIRASNVLVGARGVIGSARRRSTRTGSRLLLSRAGK